MRTLFYDNGHLLAVAIAVIVVGGLSALLTLPRLEDPRITNRNPIVLTPAPGVSAERVESQITERIERALREVSEIKELESTSRAGISTVSIELQDEVTAGENERIFSKIRDQLGQVAPELPDEAEAPTLDDERDPAAFTLIVALTWERAGEPRMGILSRLAEDLADDLRNVEGTEIVRRYGDVAEEIRVTVDPSLAASLGLSAPEVAGLLERADSKAAAGTLRAPAADIQVEVDGAFTAPERVRRAPLIDGDGSAVARVGDIATVERAWDEPAQEVGLTDGDRCVFVAARMGADTQADRWAMASRGIVDALRRRAGDGVGVRVVFDQSVYTTERLSSLAGNLALGACVVMAVVFLTMGLRSSLLVGLALPLVACASLFGVLAFGGQLHQMSIFGMIIALGLLIDNAIVVVDETRKRRERGVGAREAVGATLGHLAGPLLASTLTTALAFAPIVLLPGNAGDFVGWIGGSVILAIVSSYAISMTIIAALAGRFGRFAGVGERRRWWRHGVPGGAPGRAARRLLERLLRAPLAAMLLASLPPLAGFAVAPHMGNEFFPPVERDMFDVRVWLPRQASLERTREAVESIEAVMRQRDDVERVHWLVGGSFPTVYYNLVMNQDRASHYAQGVVDATSARAVGAMIPALQATLDERFPDAQVVLRAFGQGPPVEADVEFRLYGPSVERLQALGDRVRRAIQAQPEVLHTRTSMPRAEAKLWLEADEDAVRLAGFTLEDLADRMRALLDGAGGGTLIEGLEELPVRVRAGGERRREPSALASLAFAQGPNGWAPLDALGRLDLRPELAGVTRFDSVRCNIVEGYTREGALPIDVTRAAQRALEAEGFAPPAGYRVELGGAVEQDREARGNLAAYAPVLVTIMLAALVLTFRSAALAGVLLATAGLSVGLGLLSTWSIGFPISFNTILGTLGLIGVAFNDSIVVLAAIREDVRARAGDPGAIAEAVLGCSRHVISTTLTTIGGFLPLLLLVGGDFWPSLAIVLAGGVGGATLLALVFVPAAHRLAAVRANR